MVYIGVDLHRNKSQVAAIDESGQLVFNRKVRSDPSELQLLIDELRPQPVEVAFEATFGWGWFADLLDELGIPAHMAHPLTTKAISTARVKNDSVDAKTLAHLLRTNLLPEGWIAPPEVREARRLVRMRSALVRLRTKLKAQVHALLGEHGIQPDVADLFGKSGRAMLTELELRPAPRSPAWPLPGASSPWSSMRYVAKQAAGVTPFTSAHHRSRRARKLSWPHADGRRV